MVAVNRKTNLKQMCALPLGLACSYLRYFISLSFLLYYFLICSQKGMSLASDILHAALSNQKNKITLFKKELIPPLLNQTMTYIGVNLT